MSRKSILNRIIDEDDKYINFEHVLKYIAIADNVNNAKGEEADIYTIARFLLYLADVKVTRDDRFCGQSMILNDWEYKPSSDHWMFYHYLECLVMDYFDQYSYDKLSQGYLPRRLVKKYVIEILGINEQDLPDIGDCLIKIIEEAKYIKEAGFNILFGLDQSEQEPLPAAVNEQPCSLKLANKAFAKFWGNAHPLERDTHPENKDISRWIQEESKHKISKTMADKIAQVIRPEWAATGRKPQI